MLELPLPDGLTNEEVERYKKREKTENLQKSKNLKNQ